MPPAGLSVRNRARRGSIAVLLPFILAGTMAVSAWGYLGIKFSLDAEKTMKLASDALVQDAARSSLVEEGDYTAINDLDLAGMTAFLSAGIDRWGSLQLPLDSRRLGSALAQRLEVVISQHYRTRGFGLAALGGAYVAIYNDFGGFLVPHLVAQAKTGISSTMTIPFVPSRGESTEDAGRRMWRLLANQVLVKQYGSSVTNILW
jgi:hypothetical protein